MWFVGFELLVLFIFCFGLICVEFDVVVVCLCECWVVELLIFVWVDLIGVWIFLVR